MYDEFEFIDFNDEIFMSAGPAYVTAARNAEKNGCIHSRILLSTPGDLDSRAGKSALEIINGTYKWTEKFYDMPLSEVKEAIEINSKNKIVYIQYSHTQLGKDEAWYKDVCAAVNGNPVAIKREILLHRIHGSSMSPFQQEDLDAIDSARGTIKEEIFINKIFKLDVYEKLDPNKCYFVGVDVATGSGSDNSAVTVLDPYTLNVVGEFKSPYIGIKDYIKFLYIMIKKYLPRSILIIERNSVGEAILDTLRGIPDIQGNIYFDRNKDLTGLVDDRLDAKGMLKQEAMRRKLYGVFTGPKSRQQMFNLLHTHVADYKEKFIGNNLIDDIMSLVSKNGRIEAGPGAHDDSVMSYLMCLYVYYYGNNLHMFGFVRGTDIPKEERNAGMMAEDILSLLSETDRAFFDGVQFERPTSTEDLDMRSLINDARGLVTGDELRDAIGDKPINTRKAENPFARYSQEDVDSYMDLLRAKRESEAMNRARGLSMGYENLDSTDAMYDDDPFGVDFFRELNS